MSMADVVGLVASIITLAEWSKNVINRAEGLRSAKKEGAASFEGIRDLLPPIIHIVERTRQRIEKGEIDEKTCEAIKPSHASVKRILSELKIVLEKLTPKRDASNFDIYSKAVKGAFQEKKIQGIRQSLQEHVTVLTLSQTGMISDDVSQRLHHKQAATVPKQAATVSRKCRNLLSLDGGGLRGLSILYVLRDIMAKVNEYEDPPLKPCEVFDLIGGSGTGGLIAIMLGRLGMSVDDCIEQTLDFFECFSTTDRSASQTAIESELLISRVTDVVVKAGLQPTAALLNENNVTCYTFVCATDQNANIVVDFPNYTKPGRARRTNATIVEAACATLATARIFEPVKFGRTLPTYMSGEHGANNPIHRIWSEARELWGTNDKLEAIISCVVSIGAGQPRVRPVGLNDSSFAAAMLDIATQTEETYKQFKLGNQVSGGKDGRFFRFNVGSLPEFALDEFGQASVIQTITDDYMDLQLDKVTQCVAFMLQDSGVGRKDTNKFWRVSRILSSNFSGRSEIISKISSFLKGPDLEGRHKIFVIQGMGGMGKSEVCIKVANTMRSDFWGVFWVDLASEESARQDYLAIAKLIGHEVDNVKEAVELLANQNKTWLLLLDNADDTERDYSQYIPSGAGGCIIMTTRNKECLFYSTAVEEAGKEELEGLSEDEACELLRKAARAPHAELKHVKELVQKLDYYPIGIVVAGAYIASGHSTVQNYTDVFSQHRQRLFRYQLRQGTPRYANIHATFEASAAELNEDALCLLNVLSMLHHSSFALWTFEMAWTRANDVIKYEEKKKGNLETETGLPDEELVLSMWHTAQLPPFVGAQGDRWDSSRLDQAIIQLEGLSLITSRRTIYANTITMHSLLHAWIKDRQSLRQQAESWLSAGAVISFSYAASPVWDVKEGMHSTQHIAAYIACYCGPDAELWPEICTHSHIEPILYIILGLVYEVVHVITDAQGSQLCTNICSRLGIHRNVPDERYLRLYRRLAKLEYRFGHETRSIVLLKGIIHIQRSKGMMHNRNRRAILDSYHSLAHIYKDASRIEEAIELCLNARFHSKYIHPVDDTLGETLAVWYMQMNRTQEAVALLEWRLRLPYWGVNQLNNTRSWLSRAYRSVGQHERARELLQEVVNSLLWQQTQTRLLCLHEIAACYAVQQRLESAVNVLRPVLQTGKVILGEAHTNTVLLQLNLAMCYATNGQLEEAIKLFQDAFASTIKARLEENLKTLRAIWGLTEVSNDAKLVKRAVEMQEGIVKVMKSTLDHTSYWIIQSQEDLALLYSKDGQCKRAIEILENIVATRYETMDETHVYRLVSQSKLAWCYSRDNQPKRAIEILEKVVVIKNRIWNDTQDPRLQAQSELAAYYLQDNQPQRAVELLEKITNVRTRTLSAGNSCRRKAEATLASNYHLAGQSARAAAILKNLVDFKEAVPDGLGTRAAAILMKLVKPKVKPKYAFPDEVLPVPENDIVRLDCLMQLAKVHADEEHFEHAISVLNELLGFEETSTGIPNPHGVEGNALLADIREKFQPQPIKGTRRNMPHLLKRR